MVGGWPNRDVGTTIGKLNAETYVWSKAGDLNTSRYGHNVIFDGRHFLVVGGHHKSGTEKCTLENEKMTCVEQDSTLAYYGDYPALFLVPPLFCKPLTHTDIGTYLHV